MADRIKCNNCNIEYPPRQKKTNSLEVYGSLDYSCPICGSKKLSEHAQGEKKILLDQKYVG